MKLAGYSKYVISGLFVLLIHGHVLAVEPSLDVTKILAEVPIKNGNVDNNVYREFDRLVPKLKKISKNKIIKLECRYSGQTDREQDVENAYRLAASIEKYLRVRHKLNLDMWVAIDIIPKSLKASPVLTIAVFSDDIKKLDDVKINPPNN